jgi:hypothetical protein
VLATIASDRTEARLADGEVAAAALNSGYHLAYLVGAALVALATVVAVVVLRSQPAGEVVHPAEFEEPEAYAAAA